MTKPPWRPRASSLGAYSNCLWRAVQDRLVYEGQLPAPPEQADTSAASLGVCIHFTLQDGIRCKFPSKMLAIDPLQVLDKVEALEAQSLPLTAEHLNARELELVTLADQHFEGDLVGAHTALSLGDPRCYQPEKSKWEDAAKLWGGDVSIAREQVRTSASLGAARVPPLGNGQVWSAEDQFENEFVTGHTDFLSPDGKVLGDLKTTAKPPQGGWIKPAHLMQMTAYHILTGAERCWVLYLDSMKGRWVNVVWIDFTTDAMKFYTEQVEAFCRMLMSDKVFDLAYPNLGEHCVYSWCRYRSTCYSKIMPPAGHLYNLSIARKATGPIRLSQI